MLFNFFKKLGCQIKCEKKLTEKHNWIFLGNRMQKLKPNKSIYVEEGQTCFFRCKDKTCDVLSEGKHKISEETLPLLYKRLNIKETQKTKKLKTDVYFFKTEISYTFNFKKQSKLATVKVKEKISANLTYEVSNIPLHTKYVFLEDAVVDNLDYNKKMFNLIENHFSVFVNAYNGELIDLTDAETTSNFKAKLESELANYGISVKTVQFTDYADLTKYKKKKLNKSSLTPSKSQNIHQNNQNINNVEQNKNLNLTQNNFQQQNEITKPVQQQKNTFNRVVENGKITINPNE